MISVVIPTIPPREQELQRAFKSVRNQTLQPERIIVQCDQDGEGAAITRNKGLAQVETEYVAFLDDDDEFLPHHLQSLYDCAQRTGADLVYSAYQGINEGLFKKYLFKPFTDEYRQVILREKNFIPVTVLAKTEAIRSVGGFTRHPLARETMPLEDHGCWIKMLEAGYQFSHCHEVTWKWNRSRHTSGRSWKKVLPKSPKKRPIKRRKR